jgi:TetR/AcrR family transcriptional regulator, cholesterol catabolism regulator
MMSDKRQEIIEKVRDLYKTYGIKSVTMDDVAHHLAISKKTLYQFFSDKDELVKSVVECDFKQKNLESTIDSSKLTAIQEVYEYYKMQIKMIKDHKPSFIYDLRKYYPEVFSKVQQRMRERILNNTRANIIKGKNEEIYRSDLDEEIVARLNLMRIEGIMNGEYFESGEGHSSKLFTEVYKYHMYAIVNDAGRKILEIHLANIKEENEN